jgi:hypothetical protein
MDLKGENKALHPVGSIQELNSFEMKYGSLIYGPVASVSMISGRKISEQSKAYRLYNPITEKFIISIDVKFQEDRSWDDKVTSSFVPLADTNEPVI